MKKSFLSLLTVAALLGFAQTSRANTTYEVNIDTSALLGADASLSGPFSLDFSLSDGDGLNSNTVTLSNFEFTGGTPTGSPTIYFNHGSVTGNLSSSIAMTLANNNAQGDEIAQGFSAGTSKISFQVTLTDNLTGSTPAGFFVSIDDSTGDFIPTTALDGITLLEDDFGGDSGANSVALFKSSGVSDAGHDTSGVLVTTPESGPGLGMLLGLAGAGALVTRRVRRQA